MTKDMSPSSRLLITQVVKRGAQSARFVLAGAKGFNNNVLEDVLNFFFLSSKG